MNIIFSKSGMNDLELERGRLVPYSPQEITTNQNRYLTESNNAKITSYGSDLKTFVLEIEHLTKDNYDGAINGIKTWFENSLIDWSSNNFTLIDEFGISHTVRFWQDDFSMKISANNRYKLKIILKEE